METKIIFTSDFNTGEVFDFGRVEELLEQLPEGKLRDKLLTDFGRCQRTLARILRNTSQRILLGRKNNNEENYKEVYYLQVGPDGRGLESLSFGFGFAFFDGKEHKRDLNGGLIFHGSYKVFEEDKEDFKRLKVKSGIDFNDETLASFSIHT